ncbi:MAG TPA: hypothetical protein VJ485_03170 [archaeon]|nr:hypothetical protein [archaeon]
MSKKKSLGGDIKALWLYQDTLHVLASERPSGKAIQDLQERHKAGKAKVLLMEAFFRDVMEYNTKLLVSIRDGNILFDSLDMVKVIGINIRKGLMAGTKEMLLRKFMSIQGEIREIESVKNQVFDNIYTSCLEAAQAALTAKGKIVLVPRNIPELLRVFLLEKGLERTHIKYCEEIIWTYKALEHKKIASLTGKEIDKLARKAELFRDAVKRIS